MPWFELAGVALATGSDTAELDGFAGELEVSLDTSLAGVVAFCAELAGAALVTGSDIAELDGFAGELEASLDTSLAGIVALWAELADAALATGSVDVELDGSATELEASLDTSLVGVVLWAELDGAVLVAGSAEGVSVELLVVAVEPDVALGTGSVVAELVGLAEELEASLDTSLAGVVVP